MSTLQEDIDSIEEAKRTLKFQTGDERLATALHKIEYKLRYVVKVMEDMGADKIPRDELVQLHALFTIKDSGIEIAGIQVTQAIPPTPPKKGKGKLSIVK